MSGVLPICFRHKEKNRQILLFSLSKTNHTNRQSSTKQDDETIPTQIMEHFHPEKSDF